jgi:hypothetical protein
LTEIRRVEISLAVSCCFVLYGMVVRRQSGYMKVEGRPLIQLPTGASRFAPPPALGKKGRCRKRQEEIEYCIRMPRGKGSGAEEERRFRGSR